VVDLSQLVERVLACFQPSEFSIAVHAEINAKIMEQKCALEVNGYSREEGAIEEVGTGDSVFYQKFCKATGGHVASKMTLKCCWKEENEEEKD